MKSIVLRGALPAAIAMALLGLTGTAANAVVDPAPIGANQFFVGDVNGLSANAVIKTDCVGPIATGHPLPNQYVAVLPTTPSSSAAGVGFTGSVGNSVNVVLSLPAGAAPGIALGTLTSYAVHLPIPTKITVPCNGPAAVGFIPAPTSKTAKTGVVDVRLLSLGV